MVTKVVLYSMNYSEGLLRELPYVKYYGERGFSHLSALREPDTRVVLITSYPPEPRIIDWHLGDLFGLDDEQRAATKERLVLLSPESRAPVPLDVLVLDDPALLRRLREETADTDAVLVNFASSANSDRLAKELGLPLEEGPFELSRHWGDKASGRALFAAEGIPAPRGESHLLTTMEEVVEAAMALVTGPQAADRVVVKLNDAGWGDGLGNVVFDGKRLRDTHDLFSSVESMLQGWPNIVREVAAGGAIVEEYYLNRTRSPSGQARIDRDGTVHVVSTHEQYTVADQYLGCDFPADDDLRPGMHDALVKVGRRLAESGVRGTFGVDFIGLDDGALLATEINLRKVGPSHAVAYAEAVVGSRVGPDGNLRFDGRPVYFSHRRIYQPERLRGLDPEAALQALAGEGLLYDHRTGTGAVLHILGGLAPVGYTESTCFGSTPAEATQLGERVLATLVRAAARTPPG